MSGPLSFAPLPCFQPLECELKQFFFSPSLKRWNRRCWVMDRCAGIVLLCSALKEIIDLHYGPAHKTQPYTHTHAHTSTSYRSTPMTAPPPTWQPTPRLLIKEWMFISLPVFYRGGVISGFCHHPTWDDLRGKAITPQRRLCIPVPTKAIYLYIYIFQCINLGLNQNHFTRNRLVNEFFFFLDLKRKKATTSWGADLKM